MDENRRGFRFEVSRAQYVAAPDAPMFAGHRLRQLCEATCDPFTIHWRAWPVESDVLVIEGEGPLEVVSVIQAWVMGHDYGALLDRIDLPLSANFAEGRDG